MMVETGMHQRDTVIGRATIGDQLRRNAKLQPQKPALIFYTTEGEREVHTYGSLNRMVNRLAHALSERGVGRGDVVAIMSRNSPDYVAAYYATIKLGAALTGINFTFTAREITYQVGHCNPKVIVVESVFVDRFVPIAEQLAGVEHFMVSDVVSDAGPEGWARISTLVGEDRDASEPEVEVGENDLAIIQYTSGTEAYPKGVMIPHRNYLISTTPAWQSALGIAPDEIWLFLMPFFTIAGLGSMTSLTLLGATLVLVHAVEPPQAARMMADEKVTIMAQTPTFYLAMTQVEGFADYDFSSLRRCITYGGTVPQAMLDGWAEASPQVQWATYWGQSELTQLGSVGWFRSLDEVPGGDPTWIGKPVPQLEVAVFDDDDQPAEIGELACRSPSAMVGYYRDPQKTAETFRDGWLRTGDLVRIDDDGNLFFFDRKKDMIKSGGMNVSSQEVERVLYGFPGVMQVAVVGVPDDYWSEAVTAFAVTASDAEVDPEAVIAHCKEHLAGYKVPKAVHLVDELPTDTQGKILKRELRAMSGA